MFQQSVCKLGTLSSNVPNEATQHSRCIVPLLIVITAEVEYRIYFPLELLRQEDREYRLAFPRTSVDPWKVCVTRTPGIVRGIFPYPFTGAIHSLSIFANETVSIDFRVGEEQSIATFLELGCMIYELV